MRYHAATHQANQHSCGCAYADTSRSPMLTFHSNFSRTHATRCASASLHPITYYTSIHQTRHIPLLLCLGLRPLQHFLQLAALVHGHQDIGAADELALHENLRASITKLLSLVVRVKERDGWVQRVGMSALQQSLPHQNCVPPSAAIKAMCQTRQQGTHRT